MKNYTKTLAYFSTKARDFVKQMADGFLISLSEGKLEIHTHPIAVDPDTGITSMEIKKGANLWHIPKSSFP